MDEKYFQLRNEYLHGRRSYRTFLIQSVIEQHETIMKNCVLVHLFDRLCKYGYHRFEKRLPKSVWRARLYHELYTTSTLNEESWILLNELDLVQHLDILRNSKLQDKHWWLLVPASYRMGVWFSQNELKSFNLFPILKPGRKHVRYTGRAFEELLRSLKLIRPGVTPSEFMSSTPLYWWQYFDLQRSRYGYLDNEMLKIIPHNGRSCFAMSFSTNGVDCSILMNRYHDTTISTKSKRRKTQQTEEQPSKVDPNDYSKLVGIDPGIVNFVRVHWIETNRPIPF